MHSIATSMSCGVLVALWFLTVILYIANFRHLSRGRNALAILIIVATINLLYTFVSSEFIPQYIYHIKDTYITNSTYFLQITANLICITFLLFAVSWWMPREVRSNEKKELKVYNDSTLFKTITEYSSDITFVLNTDNYATYASPSALSILGFSDTEVKNLQLTLLIHPEDLDEFSKQIEKSLALPKQSSMPIEFRIRHKGGYWIHLEGIMTFLPKAKGVKGILLNCRDIRKRKKAYEMLNHRVDMDALVSKISTQFINMSTPQFEQRIHQTLRLMGDFTEVDYAYLFIESEDKKNLFCQDWWGVTHQVPEITKCKNLSFKKIPWLSEQMKNQGSVYIPKLETLPQEADKERTLLSKLEIRSLLLVPVRSNGEMIGFIGLDTVKKIKFWSEHDISLMVIIGEIISHAIERFKNEQDLRRLTQAVEQSPASVLITDLEGNLEYTNPTLQKITGYKPKELIGKNVDILRPETTAKNKENENIRSKLQKGHEWRGEVLSQKKNGQTFWEFLTLSPIRNTDGSITHFLGIAEDISLQKEYEEKVVQKSNYDDLTGLPNRVLALDRLKEAIARANHNKSKMAVMFLGLDTFKKVNETLGHTVGDQLLTQASSRLKEFVSEVDTLARLGGDEFLLILPDLTSADHLETRASKILSSIAKTFDLSEGEISLTASIGITVFPSDGVEPHILLRNAGSAMHKAKDAGGNTFQFFTLEMHETALKRAEMEKNLRRSMEFKELSLFYQPIINSEDLSVSGAEALLRWNSAQLGFVSPVDFIPLAEDIGFIHPMGEWIFQTACRQAKAWSKSKNMPQYITVNVSARQFGDEKFADKIIEIVKKEKISTEHIKIEVTESLLIEDEGDNTLVQTSIQKLKDMGIQILLDDFGTGYSSLSYLKKYDFSTLKIDRSFVNDTPNDPDDCALVEAVIAMAHSLSLNVVAEGVETSEQLEYLTKAGCDKLQGFYFSKPLPADQLEDWIKNRSSENQNPKKSIEKNKGAETKAKKAPSKNSTPKKKTAQKAKVNRSKK